MVLATALLRQTGRLQVILPIFAQTARSASKLLHQVASFSFCIIVLVILRGASVLFAQSAPQSNSKLRFSNESSPSSQADVAGEDRLHRRNRIREPPSGTRGPSSRCPTVPSECAATLISFHGLCGRHRTGCAGTQLASRVGEGIGKDARARGIHYMSGPGVDLSRAHERPQLRVLRRRSLPRLRHSRGLITGCRDRA